MSSKYAAEQAMLVMAAMLAGARPAEGSCFGGFARVLFPIVHLLQELLRFLLVDKG